MARDPRPRRTTRTSPTSPAAGAPTRPPGRATPSAGKAKGPAKSGQSRPRPALSAPGQAPLKVHVEVRVADGPEGKKLRTRQAAAIREALRWFAAHHDQNHTTHSHAQAAGQDPEVSR